MPKFNNVYCTLCAMIYLQLLGCYGEVLRNINKEFDQTVIKVNEHEEKLKTLTENCNEGMLK